MLRSIYKSGKIENGKKWKRYGIWPKMVFSLIAPFLYTHVKKNRNNYLCMWYKKSSANSETNVDIVWWRRLIWLRDIFIQYNTNSGINVDVANLVRSSSIGLPCHPMPCRVSNHRFMNMLNIFSLDWTICIYRKILNQHQRFEYIGISWKWHPNESKRIHLANIFTAHFSQDVARGQACILLLTDVLLIK